MALLKFQNKILIDCIDTSRFVPTPDERADLLNVVVPESYKTWERKLKMGLTLNRSGRSRIGEAIRRLVHRISGELCPLLQIPD